MGASFYFIASHLNRIRNVARHGQGHKHVACGTERERERGKSDRGGRHTHYAICLCHKHIKSAIKRIGSQMRHEKRYDKMEKRETSNGKWRREKGEREREREGGKRDLNAIVTKCPINRLYYRVSSNSRYLLPACLLACSQPAPLPFLIFI